MQTEELQIVKDLAGELLSKLKINAQIEVEQDEEKVNVNIEGEDLGILIGYHGETLFAFQLILSLAVYKQISSWLPIVCDVSSWRKKRESFLINLAEETAQKAITTGQTQVLANLSSWQRRVIHATLAENPKVISESEGEGQNRKVLIKLKE